ncbi:MAG: VOC family protein [Roseburia sp.]|nr:VOC family protein [Roseburia sp.]
MRIDHIALYVQDLEAAKQFFITYFEGVSNVMYHNPKTGLSTYFISFPDGGRIELMSRSEVSTFAFEQFRAGYIHIAFSVGSREAVDSLTDRLSKDGFEVMSGPRITGDGYYESSIRGFEDNIIEVTE